MHICAFQSKVINEYWFWSAGNDASEMRVRKFWINNIHEILYRIDVSFGQCSCSNEITVKARRILWIALRETESKCMRWIFSYHINAPANLFIIISTVRIWNENSPNQSSFYIRTTNYTISICSILNAFPKCSPEVPTQSTNLHQTINSTKSHAFGFERKTYRSKISCESTNTP